MMKTFNVGDKVRVVEAPEFKGSKRFIGKQLVVRNVVGEGAGGNVYFEGFGDYNRDCVLGVDLELVESKLTKKRRIEALEKDVARQETELEELRAKIEAFEQKARFTAIVGEATHETAATISTALHSIVSPNQRRAQIITDAKDFVEQTVKNAKSSMRNRKGNYAYQHRVIDVHFVVKTDEREVTAVAKGRAGELVEKAIAKCAPDDVFNADIGKAIAVGRLFDLDVERFINAIKPDEVVVGHVVQIARVGNLEKIYGVGKITDVTDTSSQYYYDPTSFKSDAYRPSFKGPIGTPDGSKIIDDTEAQYV